jgi:hypothetical protein
MKISQAQIVERGESEMKNFGSRVESEKFPPRWQCNEKNK